MLLFSSASITVGGCTVFPDHADVNQFWYLPGPVDFAPMPNSEEPQFTLIEYAPDVASTGVQGVGFLNLTTALRLKDETRRDIMGQLRSSFPTADNPRLAPVPFDDGSVRIVALDLQGGGGTKNTASPGSFEAVETILGAVSPELFGDNNALFSLTLTEAGASIMKAAFEGGMAPVGVIYDLKFTGVRPALDVKITADLKRVYDSFSVDVTAKAYFVSAGIDATFEKLRQDGAIKIQVVNLVGDQTSLDKENQALALFKDQILSTWFTPSLTPATAAAADAKSVPLPPPTTSTTTTTAPKTPPATPTGTNSHPAQPLHPAQPKTSSKPATGAVAAATPPAATRQAPASPAAAGGAKPSATSIPTAGAAAGAATEPTASPPPTTQAAPSDATPPTPTPAPAPAPTPALGTAAGGDTSTTTTQAPSTGGQIADAAKSIAGAAGSASGAASPFGLSVQLKVVHQDELKTVTFEYNRMDAVQRTYAPQGYFALMLDKIDKSKHFLQVDGTDVFFNKFSVNIAPPHDFNGIGLQTAHAALDYGDPAAGDTKHGEFDFDATHAATTSWDVFQGQIKTTDYTYTVDYSFDPQAGWVGASDRYQLPPITTANRQLTLDPYATIGFLSVAIAPGHIDPVMVDRMDVAIQYSDGTWQTADSFTVRFDTKPQTWKVRLADKTKRAYTYSTICVLKDGTTFPSSAVTSIASAVVVNDAFSGGIDVLIQPAFDPAKTKAALIEVDYTDAPANYRFQNTQFLQQNNMQPTRMHIPILNAAQRTFNYRITTIGIAGVQHKGDLVATTDPVVLVGDLP